MKVNRLWSNLVWSNVDNFLTLPTDCPQRNERMSWSGDINVFSRTATYVSHSDQFLTRHMVAMRDVQTAAGRFADVAPVGGGFGGVLWGSAGIVVPWEVYLQYKDVGLLERHYPAMVAYMALSDNGYSGPAYRILQNSQYPSWLYAIDQGATSIWERLNGYTVENGFGGNNSMNSFNHYSFGAVGQWMIAYSLGIQRDEPGFKKFILQPDPDPTGEMTSAEGYYDSMYGRISSAWKVNGGILTYKATVPGNTTATLYLPASSEKAVKEGGKDASKAKGVTFIKYENGQAIFELKSGNYEFTAKR